MNHPCVRSVGEGESAWELRFDWRNQGGEGESAWELRLDWRNQGGEGRCFSHFVSYGNLPCGKEEEWVGASLEGGGVGRIETVVTRFEASMNGSPKSID
ncbi:hypothetical protein AVEN_215527-1 [Araneus ventricosus]|uniref:Uncharacterized protein n=1 Tax=Araneus ventricosus TaxID=182803 RepID=A0A4Y2BHM7_ARAVE|nr:hypothetical protein AVEN_215527-1 [Araneus ventricosus]